MDSGSAAVARDIVAILLIAAGGVLCIALTIGIAKVIPSLSRTAHHLEKVTASTAEAAPHIAKAAENIERVTASVAEAAPHITKAAENIERVTANAAEAAPHITKAAENFKETTEYLRNVAGDVAAASPVLKLLGTAGAAANFANTGVGRMFGFIRERFRG